MLRDYRSEAPHWRFAAKVWRVTGIMSVVVGMIVAFNGIQAILDPDVPFMVNGVADERMTPRVALAAMGSAACILGIALVVVRAYRPDLGDRSLLERFIDPFDTFGERITHRHKGPRSWWTGDPKNGDV